MAYMGQQQADGEKQQRMRRVPAVDKLTGHADLAQLRRRLGDRIVTRMARDVVAHERQNALAGAEPADLDAAAAKVLARGEALLASRARRVINATGVVLHTNLGRAALSAAAVAALCDSAGGYTSIELDLDSGRRGARGAFAERALAQLSGAEDALVVNNNAAAVLLALTALAKDRGVVVSRGELVEIGGGFRVPDVLARSGARMIEVGTTNRTRLSDYERAIDDNDDVAVLLSVHQGNFRQIGFVERPELSALGQLARDRNVLLIKDLGGGAMVDFTDWGLTGEPTNQECMSAGVDVLCFSCDKLLGGPQGGTIAGRADLIEKVRRDPLARALRLGRLPLVALEATMAAYLEGDIESIPTLAMLGGPLEAVRNRVQGWVAHLAHDSVAVVEVEARVGGGALAEAPVASVALSLDAGNADAAAKRLRLGDPAIMPRIQGDRLLFDGRTVLPDEDEALLAAIQRIIKSIGH